MSLPVTEHGGGEGPRVEAGDRGGGGGLLDAFSWPVLGVFAGRTHGTTWECGGLILASQHSLWSLGAPLRDAPLPPTAQEITPLLLMDCLNRSKNNNMTQIHLSMGFFSLLNEEETWGVNNDVPVPRPPT